MIAVAVLALSGCGSMAINDPHADIETRMWNVASRFDQDRQRGGMSEAIIDIQNCYSSASQPFVKVYALRDCLLLDYTAYRADVTIGRHLLHGPALPFFEDQVFITRSETYALLDGFSSPTQLAHYLRDGEAVIQTDLAQLNTGPVVIHHPIQPHYASHL